MSNLYPIFQFEKTMEAFNAYFNRLEATRLYNDFDKIHDRITDTIDKALFQLEDGINSIERHIANEHLTNIKVTLNLIKQQLPTCTTLEQLKSVGEIISTINLDNVNRLSVGHLNPDADDYYYSNQDPYIIPEEVLQTLRISMNASPLNMFFINAYNGYNIPGLSLPADMKYANSDRRVSACRNVADRVIKGELKGSHISNNFFDVVLNCPEISLRVSYDTFGRIAEPDEKISIRNNIKYVRKGGVYIILLPYTRVDDSLALWLSKALSNNTQVIKFNTTNELKPVIIIGQKDITNKPKEELYAKLKRMNYDNLLDYTELEPSMFMIPTEELTLEYFRGSQLDMSDVLEASETSIIDNFLAKQTEPLVVKDQAPLLPFNMGQVGLVLTSGCLDGIVEEVDGVYHVIKGMTTKISDTKTEISDDNNSIKSTETISNQVKINVFTADGKFISLG